MMLDFGEAVRQFYGNYTNADGRAQRSAFWWVQLYQAIIIGVLLIVIFMADGGDQLFDAIMSATDDDLEDIMNDDFRLGVSGIIAIFLILIFALVNFLPSIMLNIRRFHDLGQTGWLVLVFQLVGYFPVFGIFATITNIIWFILPGNPGPNHYGPDPLEHDTDIFG